MLDDLKTFVSKIRSGNRLQGYDEAATKQAVILPLLHMLGWDTYDPDEVKPEYSVASRRVDYALRLSDTNKAFLEAKKISEELESHRDQLLDYSFRAGVALAILTNGITWWFYLPLREGSWEQRKFYTVDLLEQEPDDIACKFEDLLSRANVETGQAMRNAEQLYTAQQRTLRLTTDLPKAWNKIISEPDGLLVELINETLEKISGFRADDYYIERFIADHLEQFTIVESMHSIKKLPTSRPIRSIAAKSTSPKKPKSYPQSTGTNTYSGKVMEAFVFCGQRYPTNSWKDFLLKLTSIVYQYHRHEIDKCLNIRGKKRPYFSRDLRELRKPQNIENSGVYVETNMSADIIVAVIQRFISAFGYEVSDLVIEAH